MKILFLTLLDFNSLSESNIYTDLMNEFVKGEHKLWVVSPSEKRNNKKDRIMSTEKYTILKPVIGNLQKVNVIEKGISTLFFGRKIWKYISKSITDLDFDLILYSTPPITYVNTIKKLKRKYNSKTYLLLKDIFPQNAVDLGMFSKRSLFYHYFRKKEVKLYSLSDYIGCMSQRNIDYILENNINIDILNIEVCPNSISIDGKYERKRKNYSVLEKYKIPIDKTIYIYGGNLGKPQGVDYIIKCIENTKNDKIFYLIIGSGTEYKKIETYIENNHPSNLLLFDYMGKMEYELVLANSDVGLLFLDKKFTIPNFPSRILSYMKYGLPIVAATDNNTDIKDLIEKNFIGFWNHSGNVEDFIKNVTLMLSEDKRILYGKNARKILEDNFTSEISYKNIMKHFKEN